MTGDPHDEHDLLPRAKRVRRLLRARDTDLDSFDTRATPGLPNGIAPDPKGWSKTEVARVGAHLGSRQERMFAGARAGLDRRRLLLVLQATDCGGKDGTVRSVVGAMNPLGMHIKAFGPPTEEERAQHFLWRINRALPPAGYVGVFNRSHYEDVLAARVRRLVPEKVWRRRYDEINRFEQDLAADGLTIIKVMLHISYAEQGKRLLARLEDPTKRWKFNPSDLDDRDKWDQYQQAYVDALRKCDTSEAPWYVVPADRKWYRNWAVANLLLAHLEDLHLDYPHVELDLATLRGRLEGSLLRGDEADRLSGQQKVNTG
jgi:PPK2 family polyphosphate:nucleotide phosphotransferase